MRSLRVADFVSRRAGSAALADFVAEGSRSAWTLRLRRIVRLETLPDDYRIIISNPKTARCTQWQDRFIGAWSFGQSADRRRPRPIVASRSTLALASRASRV